jgi:hypothetical protein
MIPKADIVDGEYQRFAHPQAIMVDKPKDSIKEIYKTLNIGKMSSWPYLVKRGCLEVLKRFPVHERVRRTALLLRGSLSIFLVEVPVLSTSPNVAKSQQVVARFDA